MNYNYPLSRQSQVTFESITLQIPPCSQTSGRLQGSMNWQLSRAISPIWSSDPTIVLASINFPPISTRRMHPRKPSFGLYTDVPKVITADNCCKCDISCSELWPSTVNDT